MVKLKKEPGSERNLGVIVTKSWSESPAFAVNPRGILVHRVRYVKTHYYSGKKHHHSVTYWCGNQTCFDLRVEKEVLVDDPPESKLLCIICNAKAVKAGEKDSDALAGRHVHQGALKSHPSLLRTLESREAQTGQEIHQNQKEETMSEKDEKPGEHPTMRFDRLQGGHAYPQGLAGSPAGDVHASHETGQCNGGMKLLEHYAGQAMQGLLMGPDRVPFDTMATWSFDLAEAMMAERWKRYYGTDK